MIIKQFILNTFHYCDILSFCLTNNFRFSNKLREPGRSSEAAGTRQLISGFLADPEEDVGADGVAGADAAGLSSPMATESRSSLVISLSIFSLAMRRPGKKTQFGINLHVRFRGAFWHCVFTACWFELASATA
jgi:hypothetical protein